MTLHWGEFEPIWFIRHTVYKNRITALSPASTFILQRVHQPPKLQIRCGPADHILVSSRGVTCFHAQFWRQIRSQSSCHSWAQRLKMKSAGLLHFRIESRNLMMIFISARYLFVCRLHQIFLPGLFIDSLNKTSDSDISGFSRYLKSAQLPGKTLYLYLNY